MKTYFVGDFPAKERIRIAGNSTYENEFGDATLTPLELQERTVKRRAKARAIKERNARARGMM